MTNETENPLIRRLLGRARFLREFGEVKSPELLEKAAAELSALRASQQAPVEADTARLDFLDRMNSALNQHFGTTYSWKVITNHNVNRLFLASAHGPMLVDLNDSEAKGSPSCRDAIDAKMKELGFATPGTAARLAALENKEKE